VIRIPTSAYPPPVLVEIPHGADALAIIRVATCSASALRVVWLPAPAEATEL
jgi:hypothetical protein